MENVMNKTYIIGDKWFSTDGCTKYACEKKDNNFMVSAYEKSCPDLSNCETSHIYTKGCCKYCNVTSCKYFLNYLIFRTRI